MSGDSERGWTSPTRKNTNKISRFDQSSWCQWRGLVRPRSRGLGHVSRESSLFPVTSGTSHTGVRTETSGTSKWTSPTLSSSHLHCRSKGSCPDDPGAIESYSNDYSITFRPSTGGPLLTGSGDGPTSNSGDLSFETKRSRTPGRRKDPPNCRFRSPTRDSDSGGRCMFQYQRPFESTASPRPPPHTKFSREGGG